MDGRGGLGLPRTTANSDAAGTSTAASDLHQPVVGCGLYDDGQLIDASKDPAAVHARARTMPGSFVWLGLHDPNEEQLTRIAEIYGLHPLAVEDVLHQEQRPKIERYEDTAFIVLRAAEYVEHTELTDTSEIVDTGFVRIFVGDNFVITVRQGDIGALGSVRADLEANPAMLGQGPWAVVHAIVDRIVDVYVDIVAAMQQDIDTVEAGVFTRERHITVEQIYQLKREVIEFRSAVMPIQAPLGALTGRQWSTLIPKEIRRYFRDVTDHHARVVDAVANYDDLLTAILQARLAQVTIDQNNDLRKIAAWAAIAALQTAIAGIYGMNFEHMPGLNWRYGYPAILLIMVLSSILLYLRLRRAGWL